MIQTNVFNNPLAAARMQSFEERFDCGAQGMKFALSQFLDKTRGYRARFHSKHPNGFNDILDAATGLAGAWQSGAVLFPSLDAQITLLIQRIELWLKRCKSKWGQALQS